MLNLTSYYEIHGLSYLKLRQSSYTQLYTKAGTTFNEKAILDVKTHFKWDLALYTVSPLATH